MKTYEGRNGDIPATLAALSRAQRQAGIFPTDSVITARATFNARDLRILLLGFERIVPGDIASNPLAVVFDETLTCRITGVHFDLSNGGGLVIEAS